MPSYCFEELLFDFVGPATNLEEDHFEHVVNTFGGDDDVERGRNRPAFFEIRNPQLAPRKLPLNVGFFLWSKNKKVNKGEVWRKQTCPKLFAYSGGL